MTRSVPDIRRLARPKLAVAVFAVLLTACGDAGPPDSVAVAAAEDRPPVPEVTFAPKGVTLDWPAGEMEIRGTLIKAPGTVAPDTVWVWAYYVNPTVTLSGSWSDAPIAVVRPFVDGDTAAIVARGPFHWATNRELPRRGYFARVHVSAASADYAQVPSSARAYDTIGTVRARIRSR